MLPVSTTQGPTPVRSEEQKSKPRIFSISHKFTENWIRIQQIAKLIGRKK